MKKYMILIAIAFPLMAMAQTTCNFETQDYESLGVYDDWTDSPFTTGALTGNVAVVANTIKAKENESEKIVAFQRSRYASSIYGAKVRLQTPFELTQTTKYVHVMIHKPVEGRVMLVGLGKRTDRPGQSDQVVQFQATSITKVTPGQWCDAVFPVRGNGGIMVSSLVVVPDCESTHNLTEDYMTYFDDIVVNTDVIARYREGEYFVNFGEMETLDRNDRHLDGVSFTGNKGGSLTVSVPTTADKLVFHDLTNTNTGLAVPGETLTPKITYVGSWMHGYLFLDFMNDGKFGNEITTTGTPTVGSDVVAYSAYSLTRDEKNWANSTGASTSNNPGWQPPSFTLPADMTPGIYRMRYKVDWDNIDAGGNISSNNHIRANGGGIVDVLLNVHKTTSHVKIATRNGDVLKTDGTLFEESDVPFGQPITIELKPENGFQQNGVIIKHGYLDKEEFIHRNRQWKVETIPASDFVNNKYTIPAAYVDGDMLITAEFAEATAVPKVNADDNLRIKTSKQSMTISVKKPALVVVNDLSGRICYSGKVVEDYKLSLPGGVYFVNKHKVIIP